MIHSNAKYKFFSNLESTGILVTWTLEGIFEASDHFCQFQGSFHELLFIFCIYFSVFPHMNFLELQLTLEQHRVELRGSTSVWIFFNKYRTARSVVGWTCEFGIVDMKGWLWDWSMGKCWYLARSWKQFPEGAEAQLGVGFWPCEGWCLNFGVV